MDVITATSLDFAVGSTNLGGTQGKVFYVPAAHIKTWPELDPLTLTYSTEPVLITGKKWNEIYYTKDTGMVEDKEVGELDGGSFEVNCEFFHPRVRAELLLLKSMFINGGFILVMKDGNGVQRVIGSPDLAAYRVSADITTGKAAKDRNGATFKFTASSATPAPICDFDIVLTVAA